VRAEAEAAMLPIERWAPLVTGVVLAAPIVIAPYPPMSDLPLHEAAVAILRGMRDPSLFPPGLYVTNLGHPNQLFHMAALALAYVVPVLLACKLVVAGATVALPLGAARLADHLGASRWTAVLVAPIALGWLFIIGLVANVIGLACLLALFPLLDRFVDAPTARGAVKVSLACVVLYFAHEAMLFMYAGALLLFVVARARTVQGAALAMGPFAFAVAITLAQQKYQAGLFTSSVKAVTVEYEPLSVKLGDLPEQLYVPYDGAASRVLFALAALAAVMLATRRLREHRAAPAIARGPRVTLDHYRYEVLAILSFAAYLTFPVSMHGANLVYHRFLSPAFALALIAASPRRSSGGPPPVGKVTPALASIGPLAMLAVILPGFAESSRSYQDVQSLLGKIAPGSAVMTLQGSQVNADVMFLLKPSMAVRSVTERGGRALFSFVESPISPVIFARAYEWSEPIDRIVARDAGICPRYDFTRFRYLLFMTTSAPTQYVATFALQPDARLLGQAGNWALYESTKPVVPARSPDGPGPGGCPSGNLNARMAQVQDEVKALLAAGKPLPPLPEPASP
jgi:hypothetical protein